MTKYRLRILDIIEEVPGTKTYFLEKPEDFIWEEGAHTHIGLVGFDEGEKPNKEWVRHMSIMTTTDENRIGFTTRFIAPFSEFKEKLSALKVGDELVLFKVGSKMYLRRENRPLVLLSMGVGVATMRPLIHSFIKDSSNISSIIHVNVDSSKEYIYYSQLEGLTSTSYKNYWTGSRSEFYEEVNELSKLENALYYVVGSHYFLLDVIKFLKSKGIENKDIVIDKKDELQAEYFI